MNIFYVNKSSVMAAQSLCDKHVVKMILESAQLLSTAHRLLDGDPYEGKSKSGRKAKRWKLPETVEQKVYQATHINHPSAKWTRESAENYRWLYTHWAALMAEYAYRYGKDHKCLSMLLLLRNLPKNIPNIPMTKMPSCMAPEYIISQDPVENYRNYYRQGKKHLHKWTKRNPPEWIINTTEGKTNVPNLHL